MKSDADDPVTGAEGAGFFFKASTILDAHNACSCGEGWNCYAKISPGENYATFLNSEIFPAKFSPGEIFPSPVAPAVTLASLHGSSEWSPVG